MSLPTRTLGDPRRVLVAGGLLLVLLVAVAVVALPEAPGLRVSAYFNQAVGIYRGSDLRILGVKVGTVGSVHPQGPVVKVSLKVKRGVRVPATANAIVVAPSVVADRYIQLSPAYTGGPRLQDHAEIPAARTATPAELDQLYDSITKLTDALGPNGVNAKGALSDVLNTGAANLGGNGKAFGDMIREFGKATKTLSGSQEDLFGTLSNLQKFTTMLKGNDDQVRLVEQQLASVNGFLAEDRETLGAALDQLGTALAEVQRFIRDNRARIKSNVGKLASITQVLVEQRRSLAQILDTVPLAADNVVNAYDPVNQTLVGRGDLNEISMGGPLTSQGTAREAAGQVCAVTGCPGAGKPVQGGSQAPLPLPPIGGVFQTGKNGAR